MCVFFFLQEEDGIRDLVRSRGLGDVYKRQAYETALAHTPLEERVGRARLHRKIGKSVEGGNGTLEAAAAHYEKAAEVLGTPAEGDGPAVWEEGCQIQMEQLLLLYWWKRAEAMA